MLRLAKALLVVVILAAGILYYVAVSSIHSRHYFRVSHVDKNVTTSIPSKRVHFTEYSDLTLKSRELSEWGMTTYGPNRVLCAVPTTWDLSLYRIRRIQRTWGPLCDILVWTLSADFSVPSGSEVGVGDIMVVGTKLNPNPVHRNIWDKVHRMWVSIADKYIDKAEWFVKVDDDSFLFPNNLREFTKFYNPRIPRYFGHTLYNEWKSNNIVFNGGAAYVLSREALLRVSHRMRPLSETQANVFGDSQCNHQTGSGDDIWIAACLRDLGIVADNTLDQEGRMRFFAFRRWHHEAHERLPRDEDSWYWKYKPAITATGANCCVPPSEVINMHGYKGNEDDDQAFQILHDSAITRRGYSPRRVPPPPRPFLFDRAKLDFRVDQRLNRVNATDDSNTFKGFKLESIKDSHR